jgi:hypothetical protein
VVDQPVQSAVLLDDGGHGGRTRSAVNHITLDVCETLLRETS